MPVALERDGALFGRHGYKHITALPEYGDPFKKYMFRHIVPTIQQGFRLLKTNEPEMPLKALGELFLGVDDISGWAKVGFARGPVAEIILEANRALSDR
jgi:hypothetical protein